MVSDCRASLDEESEIKPAMQDLVEQEFERGPGLPLILSPDDGTEIVDSTKLTLAVMRPEVEWTGNELFRAQIAAWTRYRGKSPRLYAGAIVWFFKKPGRDLRDKVELWLAWKRVKKDVASGILGDDYDRNEKTDIEANVQDAEEKARDEVWGGYRFVVIADQQEPDGLKVIDLCAGHSSGAESLCGRVITTLKSQALLNESVGAGYLERNWPPALKDSGAWPLASLRQSFLNGALTRLLDPDIVLRNKIVEFVGRGDFSLASGLGDDGAYGRVWFEEIIAPEEVAFESNVFLLTKSKSRASRKASEEQEVATPITYEPLAEQLAVQGSDSDGIIIEPTPTATERTSSEPVVITLRLYGNIPSEPWNRFGTKVLPKLRGNGDLRLGGDCSVTLSSDIARNLTSELMQILSDLGLENIVKVESNT